MKRQTEEPARMRFRYTLTALAVFSLATYMVTYLSKSSETLATLQAAVPITEEHNDVYVRKIADDADVERNKTNRPIKRIIDEELTVKSLEHLRHALNAQVKEILRKMDILLNRTERLPVSNQDAFAWPVENHTYLLTLFTTWPQSADKNAERIHRNTYLNWASFQPAIKAVLVTNESDLAKEAEEYGWSIVNLGRAAPNGLPVIKDMFINVIKSFNSQYYGYANSDILFDESLLSTLLSIRYSLEDPVSSAPLLISGKRFNVINVAENEILSKRNLRRLVAERGKEFLISAEDYFISNWVYPWADIPKIVIGAPAYDNWIVMNSRKNKFTTIDATRTLLAVHQSLDSNDHRSHFRDSADYNKNLLSDLFNGYVPYNKGFTDCIETYTDIKNDTVLLLQRPVHESCWF